MGLMLTWSNAKQENLKQLAVLYRLTLLSDFKQDVKSIAAYLVWAMLQYICY